MPEPRADETQDEFTERCMSELVGDEGRPRDQAFAMCSEFWTEGKAAKFREYTYNGVTVRATGRRSSDRDDKAWERTVLEDGEEYLVHYADPDMPMRRNNEEARASFNSRHSCDEKTDPRAPGFWACYDWNNPDEKSVDTADDAAL